MKPICGIRTMKGIIALGFVFPVVFFVIRLLNVGSDFDNLNLSGSVVAIIVVSTVTGTVFLMISI